MEGIWAEARRVPGYVSELPKQPGWPPLWVMAAVALPHLWYLCVVNSPRRVKALCKRLGSEPVDVFSNVALMLNAAQLGATGAWLKQEGVAEGLIARVASWRALAALPAFVFGMVLKIAIFKAIGKAGVYYGACFGHDIAWHTGFPFNVSAHPQYLGSALVVAAGTGVIVRSDRPGEIGLAFWWIGLYLLTAIAEEGLLPAGNPEKPLEREESPFWDRTTKPVEGAELMRELLMLPVALVRFTLASGAMFLYLCYASLARESSLPSVTKLCGRVILASLGIKVRIHGIENFHQAKEHAPYVIVCNHVSYLDPIVLSAALGPYAAVARSDMERFPLIGKIAKKWGMVSVDYTKRNDGRSGHVANEIKSPERGRSKPPVALFSEGTTTNGRCMLRFRRGAFVPGVPVLQITLKYKAASGFCMGWVAPHSTAKHVLRMATEWNKVVEVNIRPIRTLSEEERNNPAGTADKVCSEMAASLGVPVRDETTRDAHELYSQCGYTLHSQNFSSKAKSQ